MALDPPESEYDAEEREEEAAAADALHQAAHSFSRDQQILDDAKELKKAFAGDPDNELHDIYDDQAQGLAGYDDDEGEL